jgi:hypothetical protein
MPPVGFEATVSAGERPNTYTLDRAATGTGKRKNLRPTNDKTHKVPYPLTSSREHAYRNPAENTKYYIKNRAL